MCWIRTGGLSMGGADKSTELYIGRWLRMIRQICRSIFSNQIFSPLSGPPNKKLTSLIITYFEMRPLLQSLYFASSSSLTDSLSIWSFRRFSVASSIAMSTIHPFTLFDVNFTVFMASASVNFPIKINSLNKPSRQTPFCSQRRS